MVKYLTIALILAALISAAFFFPVFKIKNIDINQQSCASKDQLENYQIIGKNLLVFKSDNLTRSLKSDFDCIDKINIKKTLPSTLAIEIYQNPPVAKIDGTDFAVSKDGRITDKVSFSSLPTIFLPSNVPASQNQKITDPVVLFALEVTSLIIKADFAAQNVRVVEGSNIALYDTNGIIALFSSRKPANGQIDSLQAILAKAKIDATKIEKIDLRFDKPVIVNR